MKLVHPDFDVQIDFDESKCWCLTIENSSEFFKLTSELFNQSNGGEGSFVLSEDYNEIDIKKNALYIYDYLDQSINDKKIESAINEIVLNELKEGDYLEYLSNINKEFINLNDKILENIDIDVSYDENIDFEKFVKLSKYRINDEGTLMSRIVTFVDLMIKVKGCKVLILQNICSVFDENKLSELLHELKYMDINILLVNSYRKYQITDVKEIIIDNDLCVI